MRAIYNNYLRKYRGAILGWGISLALLGWMFVPVYEIIKEQGDMMNEYLEMFPPEMLAFFGDIKSMSTPDGYLSLEYFSFIPLVLAAFAIGSGGGLIAADEENGTLDLIAAHPQSRSSLFFGRFLAFISALLLIMALAFVGLYIPATAANMGLTAAELSYPFSSMFAYLLLFGTMALILSLILPSKKMTGMIAGIILVADFFIQGLSKSYEQLEPIAKVLPLNFYQGTGWIDGLEMNPFLGLLGVSVLFTLLAWWRFLRRDIRVGGEGSWQLPKIKIGRGKGGKPQELAEASGD